MNPEEINMTRNINILNPIQKLYKYKFFGFQPKIEIFYETKDFIVKTCSSLNELEKSFSLRYKVFYKEKIGKIKLTGIDSDKYDKIADHIVIIDKNKNKIVGSYRVLSSVYTNDFYSESEFDISDLKSRNYILLELGRAVIDKEYRNGIVLALLWKGISLYTKQTNADYLFGLSSYFTENPEKAAKMYLYLEKNGMINKEFNIFPKRKYEYPFFENLLLNLEYDEDIKNEIPSLLISYIKAGAVVSGYPAYDFKFRCFDFFTLLDVSNIDKRFERKFKKWS